MFLKILENYSSVKKATEDTIYKRERPYLSKRRSEMKLNEEIEILSYCLMPDHYHLLVWQKHEDGITKLLRRVVTSYVMYFNQRFKRSGSLFENVYRAVLVEDEQQILELSKYIHVNPVSRQVRRFGLVETNSGIAPEYYMYSSYKNYLSGDDGPIIKTGKIKNLVKSGSYKDFMDLPKPNWEIILGGLLLE
jgi:putative transposase